MKKNIWKSVGIIALVAVIGLGLAGCSTDSGGGKTLKLKVVNNCTETITGLRVLVIDEGQYGYEVTKNGISIATTTTETFDLTLPRNDSRYTTQPANSIRIFFSSANYSGFGPASLNGTFVSGKNYTVTLTGEPYGGDKDITEGIE